MPHIAIKAILSKVFIFQLTPKNNEKIVRENDNKSKYNGTDWNVANERYC